MSQVFETYNYLLRLKAGDYRVLYTQSIDAPEPISRHPIYRQAYNAIKQLNYNQKGKFDLILRTSRDGTRLAAICTFDGENEATVPEEFARTYGPRKAAPVKTHGLSNTLPLSHFMKAHHEGRPVEVFVSNHWRPVEPDDWVSVSPENFRTRRRVVVVFWDSDDPSARELRFDPSEESLKSIRTGWEHVRMFYEEE